MAFLGDFQKKVRQTSIRHDLSVLNPAKGIAALRGPAQLCSCMVCERRCQMEQGWEQVG